MTITKEKRAEYETLLEYLGRATGTSLCRESAVVIRELLAEIDTTFPQGRAAGPAKGRAAFDKWADENGFAGFRESMFAAWEAGCALSSLPSEEAQGDLLTIARDALEEIALAGMSGSGQESEEGMRDWHARRAWEFIGIAARAKTAIDAALSSLEVIGKGEKG